MRVGLDARVLFGPHTGDRTYLLNLLQQFARMDLPHEFTLFTDRRGELPFALPSNFRLMRLPRLSRWLYTGALLPCACAVHRVDLLHGQYIAPLVASCPTVTTVHDVHWRRFPETFPTKDRWLMDIFLTLTFRRVVSVITDSRASQEDIVAFFGVPRHKVRVIYLAAEERFFVRLPEGQRRRVLERYGLTDGYVLFVGVLQPRKNPVRLLHAFAALDATTRQRHPLVFVGKIGWKVQGLLQSVSELRLTECVRFTGYVPDEDLPALYQGATVFAYPALWEGFGLPVVEAMASGAPVLTSDTSSLREIAEGAAVLVDPLRVESIAEGLRRLLADADLRAALRQKGYARALQFSWRKTAEATLRVYEEVAATP
ncbi:N-acetylgalactosamine-N, N'-diacetylbacillosaminyl-diphospho-undecaprenol4-alpha-N-acetylgalactosaminyltransferase [bacterium HR17]|uniref:N-acetylgalactosamine-N, N'-diacetylbacillosaminyl-diphospho-undecaprenol 4-alpha-N-acetylgalactosaminyltransferase n=1 Tax=Candidatus Fervidibacter japonicus TaxID=2035412 RepID=A0A2H5XBR7_9BACT|nr:N-acetylgalactosamine-N, N'-diacetylbacillosaminyl-diphospho-undecaprenol4-alpha-N-acetylgalactosaminyltransferase [bacterium HR17]